MPHQPPINHRQSNPDYAHPDDVLGQKRFTKETNAQQYRADRDQEGDEQKVGCPGALEDREIEDIGKRCRKGGDAKDCHQGFGGGHGQGPGAVDDRGKRDQQDA